MQQNNYNQVKAVVKGERYEELLNDIQTSLYEGELENIKLNIDTYLEKIPEASPAAEETTKRFTTLDNWYKPIKNHLENTIKNGDELDRHEALTQKQYFQRIYYKRQYYILKRIHQMYKLYEDDSIIDYPL